MTIQGREGLEVCKTRSPVRIGCQLSRLKPTGWRRSSWGFSGQTFMDQTLEEV